jgi:hypothetical protein
VYQVAANTARALRAHYGLPGFIERARRHAAIAAPGAVRRLSAAGAFARARMIRQHPIVIDAKTACGGKSKPGPSTHFAETAEGRPPAGRRRIVHSGSSELSRGRGAGPDRVHRTWYRCRVTS